MAKVANTAKDRMRLNIELADNGIIIRNPENDDEVTLAITSDDRTVFGKLDLSNEYRAIGQKVYDWLLDVVIQDHRDELIITNLDIDIVVKCNGRPMQ